MGDRTGIEWTDATWNPVTGCTKVSQGCKHCYAERDWHRMQHLPDYQGRDFTDVAMHPYRLEQPLRWRYPRRIFVNSMSDLFHEAVPFEFIAAVFGVMAAVPRHTFQVLTKRPARMLEFFRWLDAHPDRKDFDCKALYAKFPGSDWRPFLLAQITAEEMPDADRHRIDLQDRWPLPNVWMGVSVEDQASADERIPMLLSAPAAVRWVSAEPLLGLVRSRLIERLAWVVVGGESGAKARPMHPQWARYLREQCRAAGVRFLFKQWGQWLPAAEYYGENDHARDAAINQPNTLLTASGTKWSEEFDGQPPLSTWIMHRVGKKAAGRALDGVVHDEYPEVRP